MRRGVAYLSIVLALALPADGALGFGEQAQDALPYMLLARDAQEGVSTASGVSGWTRKEWEEVFRDANRVDQISNARRVGFHAAVYTNKATGEIVIAYKATNPLSLQDWKTNAQGWEGKISQQYNYSRELALLVEKLNPQTKSIAAVGWSKGGGQATFVGQEVPGIQRVVTINSARAATLSATTRGGTTQLNIVSSTDLVGDSRTGLGQQTGLGNLPGKTFYVATVESPIAKGASVLGTARKFSTSGTTEFVLGATENAARVASKIDAHMRGLDAAITALNKSSAPGLTASQSSTSSTLAPAASASASTSSTIPSPGAKSTNSSTSSNEAVQRPRPSSPIPNDFPTSSQKPPSQVAALSVSPRSTITGFGAPATTVQPGGVSLSRAAAERMPLKIDFDASYFDGQRIVLSGRNSDQGMDAAIFLTAMRAACSESDPYFSLDPDDGALWSSQGKMASELFWERIKKKHEAKLPTGAQGKKDAGIDFQTISAARDYPAIWQDISPRFPDFKAKLVFSPEWLRYTRLGEILYKADVLLKELSSGVSLLAPGKLRASAVENYLSVNAESVAKQLLSQSKTSAQPQWNGSRLWFDIAASPSSGNALPIAPSIERADPQLTSLLAAHGLLRRERPDLQTTSKVVKQGDIYDLSAVNPRMFVRIHDTATGKDLSDHDPEFDGLARDVSLRFERYAEAYEELKILKDTFRAYVAAVQIVNKSELLCDKLADLPILDSEKVDAPLPEYHRSELFVSIGNYWTLTRTERRSQSATSSSMSGGVSIGGRQFLSDSIKEGQTDVTRRFSDSLRMDPASGGGEVNVDRRYLTLVIDAGLLSPVKLVMSHPGRGVVGPNHPSNSPRTRDEYEIENEPTPVSLPTYRRDGLPTVNRDNSKLIWGSLLLLLVIAFLYNLRSRTRFEGRKR